MVGESPGQTSDEQLAALVQAGDIEPFEEIIIRYKNKLLRYSTFITGDPDAAEDAVQETFIKTFVNIQGFNTKKKFSSWIYRIAHNESINLVKKKRPLSLDADAKFAETIASQASYSRLEELVDKKMAKQHLQECLSKLELKYKEPVVLYYIQGDTYKQISDILRIPVSTVGVRISRAKKLLLQICKAIGARP